MSKLNLKTLLFGILLLLLSCIAIQGSVGLLNLSSIATAERKLADVEMPSMKVIGDIKFAMSRYRLIGIRHMLTVDPQQRTHMEKLTSDQMTLIDTTMAKYKALPNSDAGREIYQRFLDQWQSYKDIQTKFVSQSNGKNAAEIATQFFSTGVSVYNDMIARLDESVEFHNKNGQQGAAEVESTLTQARATALAAGAIALLIGLGACLVINRRVSRPLSGITKAMDKLANGDLSTAVPYTTNRDEIGAMAAAVQVFKDNALRVQALEAEEHANRAEKQRRAEAMAAIVEEVGAVVTAAAHGNFSARVMADTDDAELRKLVGGINEINAMVDRATAEFSEVLNGVADGNLTRTVTSDHQGRLAELKTAINHTIDKLAETVTTIQMTAGEVASSAREINAGADDLSRRTEGQASSLEETAATTEQLAASVKASAQSSRHSVALAEEAKQVAETGGDIVRDAVEAMERINQASDKISAIISVIDEIAFQTNLLALNAAVEAARAGDAGKGFAVVASEVRTLAQRSSDAARDISALIHASGSEVTQGVKLVRSAGEALEKIVVASQRVSTTISEIATAASEQANGIDEMSQAVAHMDGMTQQNAALSEESAASATALNGQIQKLNSLVATFRTRANAGAQHQLASVSAHAQTPKLLQERAATAFGNPGTGLAVPAPAKHALRKTANGGDVWEEF